MRAYFPRENPSIFQEITEYETYTASNFKFDLSGGNSLNYQIRIQNLQQNRWKKVVPQGASLGQQEVNDMKVGMEQHVDSVKIHKMRHHRLA